MAQDSSKGSLIERERLLAEFDMITEDSVAALLGIAVITLRNRPLTQQPTFSKVGRDRLYHRKSVMEFLDAAKVETGGRPPMYGYRRSSRPKAKLKIKRKAAKPLKRTKLGKHVERASA